MEPGKLFIGGISWDTNEDRLREYFRTFGEVVEAVIMKDRSTGRARGFGFVIYADPAVAERVVKQKHMIDGRTVEAKKAVPRDDQQIPNRTINSIHGSPGPARTKKIFVGGLASTVTESDFKRYFEQFGTITDVVVMYDHNTQRPRGFGFITYDSEDAVERALVRTFHELNGKMVEVKRAVPKESFPVPSRSQLNGINNGVSRVSSFFNTYTHGYNPSLLGSFGVRMDERQSPASLVRSGFSPFSSPSYGTPLSSEPRMSPGHGDTANLFSKLSQMQGMNALLNENNNRRGSFADHEGTKGVTGSYDGTTYWSLWGNGSFIDTIYSANSGSSMGSKSEGIGAAAFGSSEAIWSSSPILGQAGAAGSLSSGQNTSYSQGDTSLGLGMGLFSRNRTTSTPAASSFTLPDGGYDAIFRDFYGGNNNSHWLSSSSEINASGSFEHGLGNAVSDVPLKNPAGLCW